MFSVKSAVILVNNIVCSAAARVAAKVRREQRCGADTFSVAAHEVHK